MLQPEGVTGCREVGGARPLSDIYSSHVPHMPLPAHHHRRWECGEGRRRRPHGNRSKRMSKHWSLLTGALCEIHIGRHYFSVTLFSFKFSAKIRLSSAGLHFMKTQHFCDSDVPSNPPPHPHTAPALDVCTYPHAGRDCRPLPWTSRSVDEGRAGLGNTRKRAPFERPETR